MDAYISLSECLLYFEKLSTDMKIKKLMPMDAESRRLIDWMEKGSLSLFICRSFKIIFSIRNFFWQIFSTWFCLLSSIVLMFDLCLGVYDALQKKYLKTLLFCVCEAIEGPMIEEYACKFVRLFHFTVESNKWLWGLAFQFENFAISHIAFLIVSGWRAEHMLSTFVSIAYKRFTIIHPSWLTQWLLSKSQYKYCALCKLIWCCCFSLMLTWFFII